MGIINGAFPCVWRCLRNNRSTTGIAERPVCWTAHSLQLAIVNQTYMCVVALTASIAACNINLVDEIFQP